MLKMSRGVITDVQKQQLVNSMHILYFRSIFMHTTLPIKGVCQNESIVNLNNAEGPDMHWVAYAKSYCIASCILTVSAILDHRRNLNGIW